jgi:hypothetical protein
MFRMRIKRDSESVREALRRLVTTRERATGQIDSDTFRLRPKPTRHGVPVTLYGRIAPDRDGTLILAWAFPHWAMILWIPIWCWFCIRLVHAPLWFIILGLVVCIISFVVETRRGYDLLRQIDVA